MQATRIIGFWKSKLPNLTSILPSSFSPAPGHLWESGSGDFPSPLSSLASLRFRDRVSTISYKRSGPSLSSLTFIAGRLGLLGILGREMGPADLHGGDLQGEWKSSKQLNTQKVSEDP